MWVDARFDGVAVLVGPRSKENTALRAILLSGFKETAATGKGDLPKSTTAVINKALGACKSNAPVNDPRSTANLIKVDAPVDGKAESPHGSDAHAAQ
ncbi:hypothetical protein WDW37_16460 [Bdellovibrionota bacterium FG-1]